MGSVGLDGGCNNEIGQQNYFLKMFQLLQDSWSEMDSRQYLQILFFSIQIWILVWTVCVTMCQWASASSVSIWPMCIVVWRCDAQQIKYHWYYIGFGTNRQLRTSAGCPTTRVKYWNMRCNTIVTAVMQCTGQRIQCICPDWADAAGASSGYTVCDTLASTVCLFVTQTYYSDTLVGQTFKWMIHT